MRSITVEEASKDFPSIIKETLDNAEETNIVSSDGTVVMVDESYWEEIQETLRLLRDKKSLSALITGHLARDKSKVIGKPPVEVFDGL